MTLSLFDETQWAGLDLTPPSDADWGPLVQAFLASETGQRIQQCLRTEREQGVRVFPSQVFRALLLTPLSETRVVILGQDPYHGEGQAEGLSFSVPKGVKAPPSLRNIRKEVERDLGLALGTATSLRPWAEQGVLLLNSVLTVREGDAGSHAKLGWQQLTDRLIGEVSARRDHVVFMLWGSWAQQKRELIDERRHLVLTCNHPSPLAALRPPAPFIGCSHFSQANDWLVAHGLPSIDWRMS